MKKWLAELLALGISISTQTSLHGAEQPLPPPGKEIVQEVEQAYSQGYYEKFLRQLHHEYQRAGKGGLLRGIFESAKAAKKGSSEKNQHELENLKFHIPETAEGTFENKISSLETEYYIKSLLLEIAEHRGKANTDISKKKIALTLEKLSKMKQIAQEAQNQEWIQKLDQAQSAFLSDRAYKIDLETSGKISAENSVEEKVKEIMMDSLQANKATTEVVQN